MAENRKTSNQMSPQESLEDAARALIADMSAHGLCVLDDFLGRERGTAVLREVLDLHQSGIFEDGQLVTSSEKTDKKTIRGDQITWVNGKEPGCVNIGRLVRRVDSIVMRANRSLNNGKMGDYVISGRSKAMVACYPGSGAQYVRHVDNPGRDGRCITAIYYLNLDWEAKRCGGLLQIFPVAWQGQVADVEPIFDRIVFFWSDRRNPHLVQPSFDTRYAITLWYFDAKEREEALKRSGDRVGQSPSDEAT